MSVYGMRHTSVVPQGYEFPASVARDSWEERTSIVPPRIVRAAIEAKCAPVLLPAWQCRSSGVGRPSDAQVHAWARLACSFRSPERRHYAREWLLFCTLGGPMAPNPADFRLAPHDARKIQRRFAESSLFDPRDFAGVPF